MGQRNQNIFFRSQEKKSEINLFWFGFAFLKGQVFCLYLFVYIVLFKIGFILAGR